METIYFSKNRAVTTKNDDDNDDDIDDNGRDITKWRVGRRNIIISHIALVLLGVTKNHGLLLLLLLMAIGSLKVNWIYVTIIFIGDNRIRDSQDVKFHEWVMSHININMR